MPSQPRKHKEANPGVVSKFITPFAGLLTVLTARLYDLGEPDPSSEAVVVSIMEERGSLGQADEESGVEEHHGPEILVMVGLGCFAIIVMVLCLAFGGVSPDSCISCGWY